MPYTPPAGNGIVLVLKSAYVPPLGGTVTLLFGAQDGQVINNGFDAAVVGTARVNFVVRPAGIDSAVVPAPFVTIGAQFITPTGWNSAQYGVGFWSRRITPNGFDARVFGVPTIANRLRFLVPTGFSAQVFGAAKVVRNQLLPAGFSAQAFGTATLINTNRTYTLIGFIGMAFGQHAVRNRRQPAAPGGFDAMAFGSIVSDHAIRTLFPASFISLAMGAAPLIYDPQADQVVAVDGIPPGGPGFLLDGTLGKGGFGTAVVSNRNIAPTAGNQQAFGTARVENFIRFVFPSGSDMARYPAPLAFFTSNGMWVSNKIRFLTLTGFDQLRTGSAFAAINPQRVSVGGWDDSWVWNDFGPVDPVTGRPANIRHRGDLLSPSGTDMSVVGAHAVSSYQRTLAPAGVDYLQLGDVAAFRFNKVRPSGVDYQAFGDVDRWEAGRVKTYGSDLATLGMPRIDRRLAPSGQDTGAFGTARIARTVRAAGSTHDAFGRPAIVTEIPCNTAVIANPTAGSSAAFGNPSVHP